MNMIKKRVNIEEYYSGLNNMPLPVFSKHIARKTKCRACLQDGDMTMSSITNHNEMIEALHIIGNIDIDDSVEEPAYLCYVCYKFLKSAILFRKIAHRTNETLRRPLLLKQSPDHHNDYDYLGSFEDDKPDQVYSTQDLECKKKLKGKQRQSKVTKVQCPICKKLLGKQYYYNIHLQLHNPHLPDSYVCDICGKGFKFKKDYSTHKERHETRYLFKCDICPFVGRYKERLSDHMRVHTAELKFACTQCPARYVMRARLNKHIKLKHTKPQYKCTYCAKAFHSNLNLQRHIDASHLGIKNHECNQCGKTFSYRKKLLEHLRITHNTTLRPYVKRLDRKSVKQQ